MMKQLTWIFGAAIVVYLIGFGIDVMDIDASQYAGMSREMMRSGSYLQVYEYGKDYLDKPPFLLWVSALSMKVFGVNNFAYKFPSLLFALLALFSTYKLSLLYYKKEVAILAALVLASCQAFFLMTNDVRTDTILMSWVIFSIWQLASWFKTDKLLHFVFGCAGIAGGLLTKGPIALMIPLFAFGAHFLMHRNLKVFFRWQYLLGIVIIALLLLPMCIGLYQQFDMQPQKIVHGKTGVSGLRFFFWTQSFGRITGESVWNNNANIFFLFQNLLWGFLPWIFVFIAAFVTEIKAIIQKRGRLHVSEEWICMGGFILGYLALGSSRYQLPHYIYVTLPFIAIITAKYLHKLCFENGRVRTLKLFEKTHFVLFALLWVAVAVLLFYSFPAPILVQAASVAGTAGFLLLFFKKRWATHFIAMCLSSMIGINFFLNIWLYPAILQYQVGSNVGRWIKEKQIPATQIFTYKDKLWHSLQFYANADFAHKDSTDAVLSGEYLITAKDHLPRLDSAKTNYDIVYEMGSFKVSQLKLRFLNPASREKIVRPFVVIKIR
ncbi:MAG: hypothetical protein EOP55_08295 [Sphingobacteriales bacterium]|nr:MAG: hypothetical protein EOP55_08295 [Sphingobacteriales bacterium]